MFVLSICSTTRLLVFGVLLFLCWGAGRKVADTSAVFNGEKWIEILKDKETSPEVSVPLPPLGTASDDGISEIFIGILNFRDPRCGDTLRNLFTKAKYPDRVRIGLVQHRSSDDVECIKNYCGSKIGTNCPHLSQISTSTSSQFDAKSFSRGRSVVFQMLKDEEFCMSTEGNVDVIQDWDAELIAMWRAAENEYAVLTTYPPIFTSKIADVITYSKESQNEVPHLCQASYFSTVGKTVSADLSYNENLGVIENLAPRSAVLLPKPLLTTLYSSAFSFSKCHMERKVRENSLVLRIPSLCFLTPLN